MADHLCGLCALEDFLKQVVLSGALETLVQLVKQNVQELSCILLYSFEDGRDEGFEEFLRYVVLSL